MPALDSWTTSRLVDARHDWTYTKAMKRRSYLVVACLLLVAVATIPAQEESPLLQPDIFLESVDLGTSLASLNAAIDDPAKLQELAGRVLILDGVVASILLYSDDPADYYAEVELVGGSWDGVRSVRMYRSYLVFTDERFSGRLAERPPREPDPELIVRNDHVIVAARLIDLTEDDTGSIVPLLLAYEIRALD